MVDNADMISLYDFNIQTDPEIQARRPDLLMVDIKETQFIVIYLAASGGARITGEEKEQIQKYQDLGGELQVFFFPHLSVAQI